ncbi:MAG: YaaA family protein [Rikenellaceae bacterium]
MIALISPAKTMLEKADVKIGEKTSKIKHTQPRFLEHTHHILSLMLRYSAIELEEIFKVSTPIARQLKFRFESCINENEKALAALESYDGVVFKHFKDSLTFSAIQQRYLQKHLRISSLLYGLLRPLDFIQPYRMEGFVRLYDSDERVDKYWRNIQTQKFIEDIKESGGTLLYLASKEEQKAFNWKEVTKAVRVIDFQFLQYKGDKLKQVVIHTKMARGEMIRYMLENNITNPEKLKAFEWSGFCFNESLSDKDTWVWVM